MLELKFNKRLQESFEKNDLDQIVRNLSSHDFKSLIQVNNILYLFILYILYILYIL